MDRVKVKRASDGQWYWVRVAANGEPIATSETYTTRANAVRAARREAGDGATVEVEPDLDLQPDN